MTLTEQIAEALAKPFDKELRQEAVNITFSVATQKPHTTTDALYTLLIRIRKLEAEMERRAGEYSALMNLWRKKLDAQYAKVDEQKAKIRDLEAQVEQERWRDATKEKPDSGVMVLCLGDGICFVGTWSEHLQKWQEGPSVREVWKWKPIIVLQ